MMRRVFSIASITLKEALRDRILYTIVFFCFFMISLSLILDEITVGQQTKIIKDFGLSIMSLFGAMLSIFVGINLLYKEIEKRTVYNIISKPVKRYEFIMGKYMGLTLTLFIIELSMGFVLILMDSFFEGLSSLNIAKAVFFVIIEVSLVTAIAIFFSSISTPILSGIFTFSIYVIGHFTNTLMEISHEMKGRFLKIFIKFIYYLLPNLENFNLRTVIVYDIKMPSEYYLFILIYGLIYIAVIMFSSCIIFEKRDLK